LVENHNLTYRLPRPRCVMTGEAAGDKVLVENHNLTYRLPRPLCVMTGEAAGDKALVNSITNPSRLASTLQWCKGNTCF